MKLNILSNSSIAKQSTQSDQVVSAWKPIEVFDPQVLGKFYTPVAAFCARCSAATRINMFLKHKSPNVLLVLDHAEFQHELIASSFCMLRWMIMSTYTRAPPLSERLDYGQILHAFGVASNSAGKYWFLCCHGKGRSSENKNKKHMGWFFN